MPHRVVWWIQGVYSVSSNAWHMASPQNAYEVMLVEAVGAVLADTPPSCRGRSQLRAGEVEHLGQGNTAWK